MDPKQSFQRYDIGAFKAPVRMDNGFLKVDAFLTRVGVFEYMDACGRIRKEFRPPDEVNRRDSLETLSLVPVTLNHPPEMVNSKNFKQYSVGTVGERIDTIGDFVHAQLMLTDESAIKAITESGIKELSCGYIAEVEDTPGIWEGIKYDAVQKNIRYNHVAAVEKGRAGKDVRMHLDSTASFMLNSDETATHSGVLTMTKIKIDGVDFDCSESLSQAIAKTNEASEAKIESLAKQIEAFKTEKEQATAKLDEANAGLEKMKTELAEATAPEKIRAIVDARVKLEKSVSEFLGSEVKLDTMSDLEIKKAVVLKAHPEAKLDEKPAVYIEARFDAVMESKIVQAPSGTDVALAALKAAGRTPEQRVDSEEARKQFTVKMREMYKQPLSQTKDKN